MTKLIAINDQYISYQQFEPNQLRLWKKPLIHYVAFNYVNAELLYSCQINYNSHLKAFGWINYCFIIRKLTFCELWDWTEISIQWQNQRVQSCTHPAIVGEVPGKEAFQGRYSISIFNLYYNQSSEGYTVTVKMEPGGKQIEMGKGRAKRRWRVALYEKGPSEGF